MLRGAGKSGSMFGHRWRGRRMRKEFAVLAVGCLTLGLMAALGSAQGDKASRPSPPAQATFDLGGGKTITVDYSSPPYSRAGIVHSNRLAAPQVKRGLRRQTRSRSFIPLP